MNVADSSNLQRNLILTRILLEFGIEIILGLNMMDIARGKGLMIDNDGLSKEPNVSFYSYISINKNYQNGFKI